MGKEHFGDCIGAGLSARASEARTNFDLYAVRNWPAAKVASELGVSVVQVYLVNHRLGRS